jgi:hypothetical protein
LWWNGPDEWREEIHFPHYDEIEVGKKEKVWLQRSTNFLPISINTLHSTLGFGTGMVSSLVRSNLSPADSVKKVRERKEHGVQLTCFEFVSSEAKPMSDICVDDKTNTVARSFFVDKDLQVVGGEKLYPRRLSFVEAGKTLASASITELSTPGHFPPNFFTPPSGVAPRDGCMNPSRPRAIKTISPEYPPNAIQERASGRVAFDSWIGIDGVPRVGTIVVRGSPDLERVAEHALKEWRFEPATCRGKPVEIEAILVGNFHLRH